MFKSQNVKLVEVCFVKEPLAKLPCQERRIVTISCAET